MCRPQNKCVDYKIQRSVGMAASIYLLANSGGSKQASVHASEAFASQFVGSLAAERLCKMEREGDTSGQVDQTVIVEALSTPRRAAPSCRVEAFGWKSFVSRRGATFTQQVYM